MEAPSAGNTTAGDPVAQLRRLRGIMARLRGPGGCPWDQEQTHASLTRYLVEECAEVLEAVDRGDPAALCEELGDLLLQVYFHAVIAEEKGQFDVEDVARGIADKMVQRHPHVFGDRRLETADEVLAQWDQLKAAEKAAAGRPADQPDENGLKRLPPALPATLRAFETYKQLRKQGRLEASGVDGAAVRRLAEGLTEITAGGLLFHVVAACREQGIDPELALRRWTADAARASRPGSPEGGPSA